ncbi:MAG: AMP-dependent synthetase/ligase [Longimicrobiales bacterium]
MERSASTQHYVATPAELEPGTLVELFFDAVSRDGDREALRVKEDGRWRSITYRQQAEDVHRLARALGALGVRRGDRIALLAENRPEWALTDFAILCVGAVGVPFYPSLPADQIRPLLEDSGAKLIFVSTADQLAKVREVRRGLERLERIIVFDDVVDDTAELLTLRQTLELGEREGEADPHIFRRRALEAVPEDLATIIYTSGTTGRPKGVMLTHDNVFSNVEACSQLLETGPDDLALSFLPLSHIFERMLDYWYFRNGCVIAYVQAFDQVAAAMREAKPTIVGSVPRLYEKIYARVLSHSGLRGRIARWARDLAIARAEQRFEGRSVGPLFGLRRALADRFVFAKIRAATGGRLRFFISGGAPLALEVAKFFYGAGLVILEGYGLTETSPVTNVNTPSAIRLGTVGRPVPGTEEMIGEAGEILVRGPQVMKGYYGMPDQTAKVLDADGWFHTGDIGEIDEDGFLRITDRMKDLIVTAGGKNIAPQPIENRAKRNRFVGEAVMIGDRRPFPILLVVPDFDALRSWAEGEGIPAADDGALVRDDEVQAKMQAEVLGSLDDLAGYERPKKLGLIGTEFTVESGELTPSMKVKRRVVQERYAELIEALYALGRGSDVLAEGEAGNDAR